MQDTTVAKSAPTNPAPVVGRLPRARNAESDSRQYTLWMETVGNRLRLAREKAGLTQLQLGRLLGSSEGETQGYISRIEAGKINLTAKTIVRLTELLQMSLSDLLCPPFDP